jgi:hypothetical protein
MLIKNNQSNVQKTTNNTCMVHSVLWLRLFLLQDLFIDMESDCQTTCCMTLRSKIVVNSVKSYMFSFLISEMGNVKL